MPDIGLVTRIAGLISLVVILLLPVSAPADEVPAGSGPQGGADHLRQHAETWKAQARARARWQRMTRAERRRILRRQRRAARTSYMRAHASADAPAEVGSWAPPFNLTENYRGYAIHAAMLHTGKVLMWGYPLNVGQPSFRGNESYAWLWDPARGYGLDAVRDVTPVDAEGRNISIYCSGESFLADGRVLVVGGNLKWADEDPNDEYTEFAGLNKALIFDPATETWTDLPRPEGSRGRWYPTQTLMPDGRTFVISGLTEEPPGGRLNDGHEIFDPATNSFTLLTSDAQRRVTELYPHLFVMPDGKLLMAGPDPDDSAIFDPANLDAPWTDLPPLASQRIGGNAVLLPEGPAGSTRVAAIGGRPYDQPGAPGLPPAFNEIIDTDDASPAWGTFPGLNVPRSYPNTVLLPDRSIVTVGGDDRVENHPVPERAVEIYDPATATWRVGPSQVETRAYHSTALLLPDGRVLSAGDDLNPTPDGSRAGSSPNDTGEIYSPPYLFKGPRPIIRTAPRALRWDVPFAVEGDSDVDEAVLIAPAAVTHGNDMNQRLVPLRTVSVHPGAGVTLQSPPSANVAPPGWYMLFLVRDGVPSVASWVRLDAAATDVPVTPRPAPDVKAPALRVTMSQRGWLGRLRRSGRLALKATVNERAKVTATLSRGRARVARSRVTLERAGARRLTLRPRRSTLRWLRRARAPKVRVAVVAVDAAKNDTAWTRLLKPAP